jgi:hypothetical protein
MRGTKRPDMADSYVPAPGDVQDALRIRTGLQMGASWFGGSEGD